jgi:hypothetical protein
MDEDSNRDNAWISREALGGNDPGELLEAFYGPGQEHAKEKSLR